MARLNMVIIVILFIEADVIAVGSARSTFSQSPTSANAFQLGGLVWDELEKTIQYLHLYF